MRQGAGAGAMKNQNPDRHGQPEKFAKFETCEIWRLLGKGLAKVP
jgi:hypothetical protein